MITKSDGLVAVPPGVVTDTRPVAAATQAETSARALGQAVLAVRAATRPGQIL